MTGHRTDSGIKRGRAGCLALLLLSAVLFGSRAKPASASAQDAVWPAFSEEGHMTDGLLGLDASHASDGYVLCRAETPTGNRLKLRVSLGEAQLTYDLDAGGQAEIFPLQMGSGVYTFSLFENVDGSKYASGGQLSVEAAIADANAPFLVPNQYVPYTEDSPSVRKAGELGGADDAAAYQAVCDFMASEFTYDYARAQSISPGELPEPDSCFEARCGICQDLSAVMISMLRVQGIPSKLMIGFADGYYHAWTVSVVGGEEKLFDPTAAVTGMSVGSYQIERFY